LANTPKVKGIKGREEIEDFSDVDAYCTSTNECAAILNSQEDDVYHGGVGTTRSSSTSSSNKKKDKNDMKKDVSSALKSPSTSRRGPLKRSESGLNFILEDNDEIAESLDDSNHSHDSKAHSMSNYTNRNISAVQGVPDLSLRPQSRKLYLGVEVIANTTTGPSSLSLPSSNSSSSSNAKVPRSARARYLSLSSPPGLDGGDNTIDEDNIEDSNPSISHSPGHAISLFNY